MPEGGFLVGEAGRGRLVVAPMRNQVEHREERGLARPSGPRAAWRHARWRHPRSRPAGVLVGNGPGDPAAVWARSTRCEESSPMPSSGSAWAALLALALGATTYKLKTGHHGANHPSSTSTPVASRSRARITVSRSTRAAGASRRAGPTHVSFVRSSLEGLPTPAGLFAVIPPEPRRFRTIPNTSPLRFPRRL